MVLRLAVGEVQADDIHALGNQFHEHAGRVGRGAKRGDDLGAAQVVFGVHAARLADAGDGAVGVQSYAL